MVCVKLSFIKFFIKIPKTFRVNSFKIIWHTLDINLLSFIIDCLQVSFNIYCELLVILHVY